MPSFLNVALPALALAGGAFAIPAPDACLAAVTGKAALGDDGLRKEHCSSFIKTVVTPAAVTVTTTITDAPDASKWNDWKKRDVTVCPNEVPNYASACDEKAYESACSVFGVVGKTTVTIPATTTTKTVYVNGGRGGNGNGNGNGATCTSTAVITETKTGCSGGTTTATITETKTAARSTITETKTVTVGKDGDDNNDGKTTSKDSSSTSSKTSSTTSRASSSTASRSSFPTNCVTDEKAEEIVNGFKDLLEYTSYNGSRAPPGRGYHFDVSKKYLAEDFEDYSDSINWMAGLPLGGVTFKSRAEFDIGQGLGQPELKVTTHNIWHSCNEITWKWNALTPTGAAVMGINQMVLTDDHEQIQVNHAEFNNAVWLASFGLQCKVPTAPAAGNSTTSARRML